MKLLEQVKVLEQAISQQCGEREELLGHINQIKEDNTSASQNTESMTGKIQVRIEKVESLGLLSNLEKHIERKPKNLNFFCLYCHPHFSLIFLQALEGEVSRLSLSLESSLLEKGEIASRLNSTQDEVTQMRLGIEKLQVRIQSDERKKKEMGNLLKGNSSPLEIVL